MLQGNNKKQARAATLHKVYIPLFTNFTEAKERWKKLDFYSGGKEVSISRISSRKHFIA